MKNLVCQKKCLYLQGCAKGPPPVPLHTLWAGKSHQLDNPFQMMAFIMVVIQPKGESGLFKTRVLTDPNITTWTFVLQSPPFLLRSGGCLHERGCRKDNRSYGRSLSDWLSRIPGRHPFPVPRVRSHRNRRGKD